MKSMQQTLVIETVVRVTCTICGYIIYLNQEDVVPEKCSACSDHTIYKSEKILKEHGK